MTKQDTIEHDAVIKAVFDDYYEAEILQIASCASCQLKKLCSVSDMAQKTIIVQKDNQKNIKTGDNVVIYLAQSKGLKAVFLGYVLPLILVISSLFITFEIIKNELISGIISIVILFPYYLILYLLRNKIENEYKFFIK